MIKKIILLLLLVLGFDSQAQVGINTTTPKAQLEIKSTNEATPANTDGLIIPKINAFPVTNPTVDQQGMLVYLTTTVGVNTPGFYYWNNPTTAWLPLKGTDGGTLDQAYDFGGAGNGRTITADTGAVTIAGTDGFVSSGQFNTGAFAPDAFPLVPRMFWNPRKAAFRAGYSQTSSWTDINIGSMSVAFGFTTTASGGTSTAFGSFTTASGGTSTAFGSNTTASGTMSTSFGEITSASGSVATAFGRNTVASGNFSTVFGLFSTASGNTSTAFGGSTASGNTSTSFGSGTAALGDFSTAFGRNNSASSFGETVLGIGATTYTPSTNGATQFRTANATDRLFVIGNAIDADNNNTVDVAERSDAMVVLKNGSTGVGTSTPNAILDIASNNKGIMVPRVSLTATNVASPIINPNGGALPESTLVYNTATAGAAPNDVSPGYYYWTGLKWNKFDVDEKNKHYTAVGTTNVVTSTLVQLMPQMEITFTPKSSVVFVDFSASGLASNKGICVSFDLMLNGSLVKRFQTASDLIENPVTPYFANGCLWDMVFNYPIALIPDTENTISINWVSTGPGASINNNATTTPAIIGALGYSAQGHRVLKVLDPQGGGGVVSPTPVPTANDMWKINGNSGTVAGTNYIGTNDNQSLIFKTNNTEQVRLLANGNFGIGVPNPVERLQVAGRALFTNGFSSDNAALVYRNDTDYMFLGPQSGSSADGGALALFGTTNVSGGNAGGIDLNVPNGQVRMSHTNGSYAFRANSTSGYAATFELNDTGLEIGHNSAGRALIFSPNSAERMRITPTGNVGIGTTTPARKFHVSNGTSGGTSNANAGFVLESSAIVYQHFLTPSANESGLLFGSNLASINGGIIFNNSLATNGIQFRAGGNANRMTITSAGDVGIGVTAPGGQLELSLDEGRKPGTGTWTLSSDKRLKTINGKYTKGLNEILQLNPILFNYKNNGEHKFEQKVLDTEFPGFIAQEVQPLFPDAVGTDADGFLNFNIHPILIASINAFKELDLKNQAVENKNRELELKLKSQEEIISNLIERLEKLEAKAKQD